MSKTRRRIGRALITLLFVLVVAGDTGGFELDTHYYLTFGLALGTCFDWDEAHVIASADQMIDDNKTTVAETSLIRKKNKKTWHAFSHPEEQLNSLWYRVIEEEDPATQLIMFGQFLHFVQDWEAHGGYPLSIGHALATVTGKDPDSLAKDDVRTGAMVGATLDFMAKMCAGLDRIPADEDPDVAMMAMIKDLLVDRWFDRVVNQSRPDWRSKLSGGLTKEGKEIMAQNKLRIAEMIEAYLKPIPEKGVPDDFQPGDPDHGIPEPLALYFDKKGNLEFELDPGITEAYAVEEGFRRGDDRIWLEKAEPVEDGWQVTIIASNEGGRPVPAGRIRLIVADPVAQEQLGEVSRPFPGLEPDQRFQVDAMIPTSRMSEQVLIGLVAEIPDLSSANNSIWFMSDADLLELEELGSGDGSLEPGTVETIEFASEPVVWFSALEEICTVVIARTNLTDPTKELVRPDIALVAADGKRAELEGVWNRLWSITVLSKEERPAAKSYGCFDASEVCDLDWSTGSPVLEITLLAGDTRSLKKITLGGAVVDPVRELCSHSRGANGPGKE